MDTLFSYFALMAPLQLLLPAVDSLCDCFLWFLLQQNIKAILFLFCDIVYVSDLFATYAIYNSLTLSVLA